MNQGKLCISIIAATVDELISKLERAAESAEIIEIRFDHLDRSAIDRVAELKIDIPLIATYRSASREARLAFWKHDNSQFWACDIEEDIIGEVHGCARRIASFHDHNGVPDDLDSIYAALVGSRAEIVKIAVSVDDAVNAIPIWKLLKTAEKDGQSLIPIAMSEAGMWTRILGPAHGAFLTYASLDRSDETAPGQPTAADITNIYGFGDISPKTRIYGVIGDPISHSMSPLMQNAAFRVAGDDAVFLPFLVKDLNGFMARMVRSESREINLNFAGFSVTMPHKQAIIPYLNSMDPIAEAIGAVNTVKIEPDGSVMGFNTDVSGFLGPLKENFGDVRALRVAVIGAGGAARAVVHALKNDHAHATVFARDRQRCTWFTEQDIAVKPFSDVRSEVSNFEVLVNATPIGMPGLQEEQSVLTPDELSGVRLVYDLVTRQEGTPLMHAAAAADIPVIGGLDMLVEQGARQFEIWTGREAPIDLMRAAVLARTGG